MVSFQFCGAAVGQLQGQLGGNCSTAHGGGRTIGHGTHGNHTQGGGHGPGHTFSGVVCQSVGNLVAHDLGELGVGQLQLLEQAGVDGHAAARHAPGIHRVRVVDNRHTPLPVSRARIFLHGYGYQSAGNGGNAFGQRFVAGQLVLLVEVGNRAQVGGARLHDSRFRGNQHELGASRGAGGTGAEQAGRGGQNEQSFHGRVPRSMAASLADFREGFDPPGICRFREKDEA